MTDFFLNLASRVANHENAIRPRVAGRFESSEPAAVLAEINEEIAVGADATPTAPDARQRRRESGMSGLKPAADPGVQVTPPRSSPPSESAPPVKFGAVDIPQSSPPVQARPEVCPADGAESRNAVPATILRVHDSDGEELAQQDEATLAKAEAPVQRRTVVSLPAAEVAMTGSAAAKPANVPIAIPAASHRPTIRKPSPDTFFARKPREMPGPAAAAPPPETVVHVTIGRVELRAPATAAPRKREQAPSQAGTLAEYLQKHAARTRS